MRIASPDRTKVEKAKLHQLEKQRQKIENQLFQDETNDSKTQKGESSKLSDIKKSISNYKKTIDRVASFDSELTHLFDFSQKTGQKLGFFKGYKNLTCVISAG